MTTGAKDTTLSTRLRVARQAAALTQTELAKRIGSDQAIISRLERGESMGTPDVLRAIGKELKVTVTYLLGEDTSDHAVRPTREAIAADRKMPKGLRDLATDDALMKAMKITVRGGFSPEAIARASSSIPATPLALSSAPGWTLPSSPV